MKTSVSGSKVHCRRLVKFILYLPPANEVCEGYLFTGVCLSTGGKGACMFFWGVCVVFSEGVYGFFGGCSWFFLGVCIVFSGGACFLGGGACMVFLGVCMVFLGGMHSFFGGMHGFFGGHYILSSA